MPTVGQHLIDMIKNQGVDTIFGLPGDYILKFYDQLNNSFRVVNTIDEQGAGFAADAYARSKPGSIGVVVTTYGVGGLKLANAIAGAYAEKSPVLFISGAPGIDEQRSGMQLHHMVGSFATQHNVFKHLTKTTAVLTDPTQAGAQIDSLIEMIKTYSMPGYLELPRDIVDKALRYDVYTQGNPIVIRSDEEMLKESLSRSIEMINASKNPIILAGVEVARFNFGKRLIKFAQKYNIPIATTLLAKSVIDETHPLSIGVYCGGMSRNDILQKVEESDCLIKLGVFNTDMNLGFQPPRNPKANEIFCTTNTTRVKLSTYEKVTFTDFMSGLMSADLNVRAAVQVQEYKKPTFIADAGRKMTVQRLFEKIDSILTDNFVIVSDIGDSLFGSSELTVHERHQYLCPAYYTSMGFSVPGALGVQLAQPKLRPIVIVGDGAFQMTGMEVSSIARQNLNPIIFVLNNHGFLTERFLGHDGQFNDVQVWNYHKVPDIIGKGKGFLVNTECELEAAIDQSIANKEFSIINVTLGKKDATAALQRMMANLAKKV